jgi:hypothetical protein
MTGHRHPFGCGLVVSFHRNNCNRLPFQNLLSLPTTTIFAAAAAAHTTITVAVLAGRLVVMCHSAMNFVAAV